LIEAELARLAAEGYTRVTLRELKKLVAASAPTGTWQRARDIALQKSPWGISGQTLVLQFKNEDRESVLKVAANM
jgi:hypothetical protein